MSSAQHSDFDTGALFARVILPLPLAKNFTYRIPRELASIAQVGSRVLVAFGKRKIYTAVIRELGHQPPEGYEARYIISLLDEHAVVHEKQLKFWEWMAAYYMCSEGDVMLAALPNYLRLESHTTICWNEEADENEFILSNEETEILNIVHKARKLSLEEIDTAYAPENLWKLVRGLYDKGLLLLQEEVEEKYKPRFLHRLAAAPLAEEELKDAFDKLEKRAPKQYQALLTYFSEAAARDVVYEEELSSKFPDGKAAIKQLVKKGLLISSEEEELPIRLKRKAQREEAVPTGGKQAELLLEHLPGNRPVYFQTADYVHKPEVLGEVIRTYLSRGQVLYLLPESAISPNFLHALKTAIGEDVWLYTGRYSEKERYECWRAVSEGSARVVVGSRSALLLPFRDLQLIILDEEHETFYKQPDPAPRFHARDSALMLASQLSIPLLLCSSTPSVESMYHLQSGRFVWVKDHKTGAAGGHSISIEKIVHGKQTNMAGAFSRNLLQQSGQVLDKGRQVILFQNLKGYVPVISCRNCGWIAKCRNCDVTLTFYKSQQHLRCNYCNYQNPPVTACAACGSPALEQTGYGTERIEEELQMLLPDLHIARFDMESIRSRKNMYRILQDFEDGNTQVLIGTQLFTRLIDYRNVGLIAILNADMLIHYPDFRAQERAFQLITQLYERSRLGGFERKLLIQARNTDHPVLRFIIENRKDDFYREELLQRKEFSYPPFTRLIQLRIRHKEQDVSEAAAVLLAQSLREVFGDWIIGPQKPAISRIRNYYLQTILIKIPREQKALAAIKDKIRECMNGLYLHKNFKQVRVIADVDI